MATLVRRVGVLALVVLGVLPGARADVYVVTSTDDMGAGTLSAAVSNANLHPGADEIQFNLPGLAPYLIELSGNLNLSEQLLLDGTSQPGYTDHPLIEVRFPAGNGLRINTQIGSNEVRGLSITGAANTAGIIVRDFASAVTIRSCYVGVAPDGVTVNGNRRGIELAAPGSQVLGDPVWGPTVVAGNSEEGILVSGTDCTVAGTLIGLLPDGETPAGNGMPGISILADGARIGGTTAAARNVISGNGTVGVSLHLDGTATLLGNYIGVTADGTAARGNLAGGISLSGNSGLINPVITGDGTAAGRNLISGNLGAGVYLTASSRANLQGNYVGVDVTGMAAVPNTSAGIRMNSPATANRLIMDGNVVSGNGGDGVLIEHLSSATLRGNLLGVNATGTAAVPNGGAGVKLGGTDLGNRQLELGDGTVAGGNLISGNDGDGVWLEGSGSGRLRGNRIGTDATGLVAVPNARAGVRLGGITGQGVPTMVGDGTVAGRNLISGNGEEGVVLSEDATASLLGNYIGVNLSGQGALPNRGAGIRLVGDAGRFLPVSIGNGTADGRNLISGNGGYGVSLQDDAVASLRGNYLGVDVTGMSALGNHLSGVFISSHETRSVIGGGQPGDGNVLSGNLGDGLSLQGATGLTIQGNRIGTGADGTTAVPNGGAGVSLRNGANQNTFGGSQAGEANQIAGNQHAGVSISGSDQNSFFGNLIGLDPVGDEDLPNGWEGIDVDNSNGTVIGGTGPGEGNAIAYNHRAGVAVRGTSDQTAIRGNRIFLNDGLGVDLNGDGVTLNDLNDVDTGPNGLLNFPVLTAASFDSSGSALTIEGFAAPGMAIDLFQADGSGSYGQGARYLASVTEGSGDDDSVATGSYDDPAVGQDSANRFAVTIPNNWGLEPGSRLTALGTLNGSTSEFSYNVMATGAVDHLGMVQQPSTGPLGQAVSPAVMVELLDARGRRVTTATNAVTVSLGDNPTGATLSGTLTVNAVAGLATFDDLQLDRAGQGFTLGFASAGLTGTGSVQFDVLSPGTLAMVQQPTTGPVGQAISPAVTVELLDDYGDRQTMATNAVTVSLGDNPTGATLSGTVTVNAVAGVATFDDLLLDRAGQGYTLSFAADELTGTGSVQFDRLSPGTLQVVQQPTRTVPGQAVSPAVTVELLDDYGNRQTGATNAVTVALGDNPTGATLSGTLTVNAAAGVATFDDLSLDTVGQGYTLSFASDGLAGAGTVSFEVVVPRVLRFVQPPTDGTAGEALRPAPTVEVVDADGQRLDVSSPVTLSSANGQRLGGTLTVPMAHGLATFDNLRCLTSGAHQLAATLDDLTIVSDDFAIAPGRPAGLVFVSWPEAGTVGQPLTGPGYVTVVQVVDAWENTCLVDGTVIHLGLGANPGQATLSGSLDRATTQGVAIFDGLVFDKAGAGYTYRAGAANLAEAESPEFTINTGPPTALRFVQPPAGATAGEALSPAVTVEVVDSGGNRIGDATDTVTLSLGANPAGGTLGGMLTVPAVAGLATFADLTIDQPGEGYTLRAASGALTAATSAAFDIVAAMMPVRAVALRFVQQPGNGAPGAALSPAITVEVVDRDGERVADATDAVTLSLGANPAGGTMAGTLTVPAVAGLATFTDLTIDRPGERYTLQAVSGALTAATSAAFDIVAVVVLDPAASSLTASPAEQVADGRSPVRLTITLLDNVGRPLAGIDAAWLTLTADDARVTITGPTGQTDAAGQIVAYATSHSPGEVTFRAAIEPRTIGAPVTVRYSPRPVSAARSTVTIDPAIVPGDGVRRATLTVVLRDAGGGAVSGSPVSARSLTATRDGVATGQVTVVEAGEETGPYGRFTMQVTVGAPGPYELTVTVAGVALAPVELTALGIFDLPVVTGMTLAGLPLTPDPTVIADLIQNTGLGVALWSPGDPGYMLLGDNLVPQPGQGVWLGSSTDRIVRFEGTPVPDGPVSVELQTGWNIIGNPFTEPLPWNLGTLFVTANGVTTPLADARLWWTTLAPYIYQWDPTGPRYIFTSDGQRLGLEGIAESLPVGAGAFIQAFQPCTLTFRPPTPNAARRAAGPVPARSWQVTVTATNGVERSAVMVGQSESLSRALALTEPPAPGPESGLQLRVLAADGRALTGDLRPSGTGEQSWRLVADSRDGRAVTLSWPGLLRELPRGLVAELLDEQTGQAMVLNTKASTQYTPSRPGERRSWQLRLRPANLARTTITSLSAAPTRGGGVELQLVLSGEAQMTLTVRGLGGRLVRQLSQPASAAGLTRVVWDGTDSAGRRVPAGSYVLEAVAESANGAVNRAVRTVTLR